MNREEFEQAALDMNLQRDREVKAAREQRKPCHLVPMLAFGYGQSYCSTHRTLVSDEKPCPYGEK